MTNPPILQGVLAVNKPTGITSTDVLRTIQDKFNPSMLFAPLIKHAANLEAQKIQRGRRSKKKAKEVKIGHGGTLDPLATGVLIAGIGDGTKSLHSFLGCKKTYETVVVFGVATDTYDVLGHVVERESYDGVNRKAIEEALAAFRGKIKQRPPTFSARWVNGERMYDLARRGEKVPDEARQERDVQVDEMELLDFWEAGDHEFVLRSGEALQSRVARSGTVKRTKRKREQSDSASPAPITPKMAKIEDLGYVTERTNGDPRETNDTEEVKMTGALPTASEVAKADQKAQATSSNGEETSVPIADEKLGPAASIRMTVSSGFYVRSLCHDLGKTLGSAGFMAKLIRTRQADFELGKNVLEYEDLSKDEEEWAPTVKSLLNSWKEQQQQQKEEQQQQKEEQQQQQKEEQQQDRN